MNKPRLSFWQIWNMSFGFLGIQFGWGLQMANMSAIYSYLGANADSLAILWLAAPVTGVLIQPLIGQSSDRIWTRLGRRRPFILGGVSMGLAALLTLLVVTFKQTRGSCSARHGRHTLMTVENSWITPALTIY
jgi:maltose/moltooligosaccharide transporter